MKELNILNGEALKDYFNENYKNKYEDIISMNECMVDGPASEDIFSSTFFKIREQFITRYFNVTAEEFKAKSIDELKALLKNDYDSITLWFDYDMYCQINLLTILAYLDAIDYKGTVTVKIIEQDFFYCGSFDEIVKAKVELKSLDNLYLLYKDILINKDFQMIDRKEYEAIFNELPWLKEGIGLYENYNLPQNEITDFINERRNSSKMEILAGLIKKLNKYGLTDVQYAKIIERQS